MPHNAYALQPNSAQSHSRTRTTSSNVFPTIVYPQQEQWQPQPDQRQPYQQHPSNIQVYPYTSRRTPSQGTFSTASSGPPGTPLRAASQSQDLRRSTSSRSGNPSTSYVALMRRQKATVWCDRAQHEDPRLLAAQKAAKMRAALEVVGGSTTGTWRAPPSSSGNLAASKGGVTAKIRHHGKAGLVGYSPGDLVGGVGGVPMRLSASEVEPGDSDDESGNVYRSYHHRTASGRSSVTSSRRGPTYSRQSGTSSTVGKWSSGNTPPDSGSLHDLAETPTPGDLNYVHTNSHGDRTRSTGSGSSGERADNVGNLNSNDTARLASNSLIQSTITREKSVRNPEELRRRGSVDERTMTMTMSAGRLYIANPDTDSD